MKVIQLNIWMGHLLHPLLKLIDEQKPDVLCAQEVLSAQSGHGLYDFYQTHQYAQDNDSNLSASLVDLSDVMSGHELCTSDPWVYGPSIDYPHWEELDPDPGLPVPIHPTPEGQAAIAAAESVLAG